MPKLKTKSGAKKRFKATKSGKFKYQRAGRRHLLEWKSGNDARRLRKAAIVNPANEGAMHQMMPYA